MVLARARGPTAPIARPSRWYRRLMDVTVHSHDLLLYDARRRTFVLKAPQKSKPHRRPYSVHQNLPYTPSHYTPTHTLCPLQRPSIRSGSQAARIWASYTGVVGSNPCPAMPFLFLLHASCQPPTPVLLGLMPARATPTPHRHLFSASRISCWLRCCARAWSSDQPPIWI